VPLPLEPFRVVANLPFSRTTELLRLLLDDTRTPLLQADLIVEWAVAHKHGVPWPSSLNGVLWGSRYEVRVSRRLPRGAFSPPPSVDAGVLVFRRRTEPLVPPALAPAYRQFVSRGFRHGLGSVATSRVVRQVGVARAMARDLDAAQWATLFLRSRRQPSSQPIRRGRR
jgi:23S rRNA (adenine-N6)-dimethyltransferase